MQPKSLFPLELYTILLLKERVTISPYATVILPKNVSM